MAGRNCSSSSSVFIVKERGRPWWKCTGFSGRQVQATRKLFHGMCSFLAWGKISGVSSNESMEKLWRATPGSEVVDLKPCWAITFCGREWMPAQGLSPDAAVFHTAAMKFQRNWWQIAGKQKGRNIGISSRTWFFAMSHWRCLRNT